MTDQLCSQHTDTFTAPHYEFSQKLTVGKRCLRLLSGISSNHLPLPLAVGEHDLQQAKVIFRASVRLLDYLADGEGAPARKQRGIASKGRSSQWEDWCSHKELGKNL